MGLKKELEMYLIKMFDPKLLFFLDDNTALPLDKEDGTLYCKFGPGKDVVMCVKDRRLYILSIHDILKWKENK